MTNTLTLTHLQIFENYLNTTITHQQIKAA